MSSPISVHYIKFRQKVPGDFVQKVGEIRLNPCSHRCLNIEGRSEYGFGIECVRWNWYDQEDCRDCNKRGVLNSKFECVCDYGYVGLHCEYEDCNEKCLNGGKCNNTNVDDWEDSVDPFICDCPPFYHGQRCQTYFCIDEKDCFNGGVCSEKSERCDCPDEFSGMQCEFENL